MLLDESLPRLPRTTLPTWAEDARADHAAEQPELAGAAAEHRTAPGAAARPADIVRQALRAARTGTSAPEAGRPSTAAPEAAPTASLGAGPSPFRAAAAAVGAAGRPPAPASEQARADMLPGLEQGPDRADMRRATELVRDAARAAQGARDADSEARRAQREAARSQSIAELVSGLNPPQRAAVEHRGGPLLIVAGAGSGKTRVLTRRIAHLLATGDARPGEILAITFTNKAAAEMRERVEAAVGPRARVMWVSTFHSACVRLLRREAERLAMRSSFSIYDQADSLRLITLVSRDLDLDAKRLPPRGLLNRISALKNELVDHEAFRARADESNPAELALSEVYVAYQERLARAHAMDFDDLIGHTVALFEGFPDVAEHYHRRFRHILVDEYQDTNHAQYRLVSELVGRPGGEVPPAELVVVGDSDQSIYAFRGATVRNIVEFTADFPNARQIVLDQNYRSTQTILSAANAVISRNADRQAKTL